MDVSAEELPQSLLFTQSSSTLTSFHTWFLSCGPVWRRHNDFCLFVVQIVTVEGQSQAYRLIHSVSPIDAVTRCLLANLNVHLPFAAKTLCHFVSLLATSKFSPISFCLATKTASGTL